jgi:hypothetical protein
MRKKADNKLTTKDLKRFYDLERKSLLTDEFVNNIVSKLIYGLQDYAIGSKIRAGYVREYVKDLEKAYVLPLNEKIIAIDQVVNEFHEDFMPELMDESEDPNKINKTLDDLFYGYQAVLDHARQEIERLKSEGETPTVENIKQHLVDYWSSDVKLNTRVIKELLESGEIQQEKVANILSIKKLSQSTKETLLKAQTGDQNAIAQVIEENMGLITQALVKWGLVPGGIDFEDTLSDIKVEIIQKVIPQWDSKRGAFSTFLTWAIFNFLRRGSRKKMYEEKQKEISTAEPIGEGLTLEDTLEAPSGDAYVTISGARDYLQGIIHAKKPELEDLVLRIFDLKTSADYSNDQIAEILNEEEFGKEKTISRFMVNNLVNSWIKPVMQQYFSSFKSASLSMRKKAGREDSAIEINKYLEDKHGFTLSSYSKRMKHLMDYIVEKMNSGETFEEAIDSWCKETDRGHPDFRYKDLR